MSPDAELLLIWSAAGGMAVVMCRFIVGPFDWSQLHQLVADEDGSAYALGYAIGLPIFGMILLLFVETTLLLVAKVGTIYAAHATARSALVWTSAQPDSIRDVKVHEAACYAMAPFSNGNPLIASELPPRPIEEFDLYAAYARYSVNPVLSRGYITAKARTAFCLTTHHVNIVPTTSRSSMVVAEIAFEAPLHSRIIGAMLGRRVPGRSFFTRRITSTAILPEDRGRAPDGGVGIEYHSN